MKIVVDENIPNINVEELRAMGHDVLDIRSTERQGMFDNDLTLLVRWSRRPSTERQNEAKISMERMTAGNRLVQSVDSTLVLGSLDLKLLRLAAALMAVVLWSGCAYFNPKPSYEEGWNPQPPANYKFTGGF